MSGPVQRTIESNGIRLNIAEQGNGPPVVLCHGFPESWYSWRHQLTALATAGFHAIAPDMRGYGKSDRPEAIDQYTIFHLIGDLVGLLDAIEAPTAVIVGHTGNGYRLASGTPALDRFRAVACSRPLRPRAVRPTSVIRTADAILPAVFPAARRGRGRNGTDPRLTVLTRFVADQVRRRGIPRGA